MKKAFVFIMLIGLSFIFKVLGSTNKPAPITTQIWEQSNQGILLSNSRLHPFSNPLKPDTFKIILSGENLQNAEATFTIVTEQGKEIFRETFPAGHLIGYALSEENPTREQEEEVIKERVNSFFQEKSFSNPAIEKDEKFTEDYVEKSIWKDIKQDRSAVGFYYLVGEEGMSWIAYSKKRKKVVAYSTCC